MFDITFFDWFVNNPKDLVANIKSVPVFCYQCEAVVTNTHAYKKSERLFGYFRPVTHWHHIITNRQQYYLLWKECWIKWNILKGFRRLHDTLQRS